MEYSERAISSVLNGMCSFCKFLSANDTGATGGHQSGILVSNSAVEIMFDREEIKNEHIAKRYIKIKWQDDIETESCFTWYESKDELRITRFGRSFPFLLPDQTGSLFVFTKRWEDYYEGYFLDTESEIEEFLDAFGISPTETNCLIDKGQVSPEVNEKQAMDEFIKSLTVDFPESGVMSAAAREIEEKIYDHSEYIITDPDQKIISWTDMEYDLFRELEQTRYGNIIKEGFSSVDDFVKTANAVLNRRKSRAGKSLEHHLSAIFDGNDLEYTAQPVTEGNKRPDFLFPSEEAYHDSGFPTDSLISLGAKTTCKDRWRQVLNEADRLKGRTIFLCTLQQGISVAQMDEMQAAGVTLVVPRPYIKSYPKDRQYRIWTVHQFVEYVRMMEGR